MKTMIACLLLTTATTAHAALRTDGPDTSTALRPVSLAEAPSEHAFPVAGEACRPVLLFMRMPDGKVVLLGVMDPASSC